MEEEDGGEEELFRAADVREHERTVARHSHYM